VNCTERCRLAARRLLVALGGFLNLSGYARSQILAGDVRFGSVRAEKVIGKMPLGLSGDWRIGLSLEAGRSRDRFTETGVEGWQQAGAVYLGPGRPAVPWLSPRARRALVAVPVHRAALIRALPRAAAPTLLPAGGLYRGSRAETHTAKENA
jgi:hypothetical protein